MSRSGFPPTPAPSTDITGKDNAGATHTDPSFKLPPSAYAHKISPSAEDALHIHQHHAPPTHILPSPTSPPTGLESNRMSNNSQMAAYTGDISLPPPPTRTRKIIQMKPGAPKKVEPEAEATSSQGKNGAGSGTSGKKKQAAGTSVGRKIARKTAHSLIERRRRSKMNEEFGVLKDMIPACSGQEMHKLAILQASIDYLRYLEQCVSELKAGRSGPTAMPPSVSTSRSQSIQVDTPNEMAQSEDDQDDEMGDAYEETRHVAAAAVEAARPMTATSTRSQQSAVPSPAFSSTNSYDHARRMSVMELPSPRADYYYNRFQHHPSQSSRHPPSAFSVATPPLPAGSNYASPMILPNGNGSYSTQASPMILPQPSSTLDHEASAALLLLNARDRRLTNESVKSPVSREPESRPSSYGRQSASQASSTSGVRGMSVQDLLRN